MRRGWSFAVLACGVMAACSADPADPKDSREPGIIEIYTSGPTSGVLQLPGTIRAGETFQATVITYGSSSCTHADGADVQQSASLAEITPYDLWASAYAVCTEDLHSFPRSVSLRFDAPGDAVIRVRGRSLFRTEAVIEQHVTVR